MKHNTNKSAFTLVELIVAVAILSLIIVTLASTFNAIVGATRSGAEATEHIQREWVAVKTIEEAVSGMVFFEENQDKYQFIVDSDFDYPKFSFIARLPDHFLGSRYFNGQNLRRIEFAIEQNEDRDTKMLVMYQTSPLAGTDNDLIDERPYWILVKDLDHFYIRYWDTNVNEWVYDWEDPNIIPTRIEIEMALMRPDGSTPILKDVRKRELIIYSIKITQSEHAPPLPRSRWPRRDSRGNDRK